MVGITCAYLSWFVPIVGLSHLPEKPGVDLALVIPSKGLLVPC
jgi:hypothetical protein